MAVHRQLHIDRFLIGTNRFKWTSDVHMKMAKYLSEHYDEYSSAIKQGKRKQFLRTMKTRINGLESLNDKRIDHGFYKFLSKYKLVKAMVNLGGEQLNGAAHKERILAQCPYFYILDETFSKTPKDIIYEPETGDIGNEVKIESDEESSSEDSIVLTNNIAHPEIETDTVHMADHRCRRRRLSLEETPLGQKNKKIKERPYMWTSDDYMKVAKYLSEHYDEYSAAMEPAALQQGKKGQFLRTMKTKLDGLEGLNDTQIKNGFNRIIKMYELVKANVNSDGKQKGTTHKQRILEQCPYFYILDATFAKAPKDKAPCITHEPETSDIGNEDKIENDEESISEDSIVLTDNGDQQEIPEIDIDIVEEDNEYRKCQLSSPVSPPNYLDCNLITCTPSVASYVKTEGDNKYYECRLIRPCTVLLRNYFDCNPITRSPSVASNVKEACKDIGVGKGEKRSIDTLIELIDSKVHDQIEVEKQRLKLEERKFAAQHAIQLKKLDIEHLKVKAESECKAQRFAMKKAKAQQLRGIKKLRLQIRLEKLKKSRRDTAEDN